LYCFIEDEFDITVSKNLPRVDSGLLKFVLVSSMEFGFLQLFEVQLSIQTLDHKMIEIKKKK